MSVERPRAPPASQVYKYDKPEEIVLSYSYTIIDYRLP